MKKQTISAILFVLILIFNILYLKPAEIIYVDSSQKLEKVFSIPQKNIEVYLAEGDYFLSSQEFTEMSCGNCDDPDTKVIATKGLEISGKNVKLKGPNSRSAVIHTNAGYGIYINNCSNCVIEKLTITDGIRDSSAKATDAAIVVKNSDVIIRNNLIQKNLGDSTLIKENVVGIMGICGRENSTLQIEKNEIIQNSWDGITLFRDAEAFITNNLIDGAKKKKFPSGGRGVGIGITWNAKATIRNNLVKRYWKGIGAFVDADVIIQNNIVEEMTAWGISVWDAKKGEPRAKINKNIIFDTGAMGSGITLSTPVDPGFFTENILIKTAQDSLYDSPDYYGYQCALAEHQVPDNFIIENNIFFGNRRASKDLPDYDLPYEKFVDELKTAQVWIMNFPLLDRSRFYFEYIH